VNAGVFAMTEFGEKLSATITCQLGRNMLGNDFTSKLPS
jgi:hypothetical protein